MKVCLFGNGFFNGILFCNLNGLMYLVVNISSVALLSFGCEVANLCAPFQTSSRLSNICKLVCVLI